ncbi:MAG: TorF family putative porin [Allosphingosinicella sp.]|uniref:TorF family putative porin n=1 Tax=Allosphingosinicella sp. TaxID=2823234 RepID=UPI00394D8A6E
MKLLIVPAFLTGLLAAAPAAALPLPGTGLDISAEATLMSDYRFRGLSRSDGDPALQGALTVTSDTGIYTGVRATTLKGIDNFRFRNPRLQDLGDVQLELYGGYGTDVGAGLSVDGGVRYFAFVGGEGATNYFEPYASASYLLGPVEATVGANWAPAQRATGDEDMLYLFGELEAGIPLTPLTLTAHAGRQDWGRYGSYTNWSLGGRFALGVAQVGVRYVDTNLPSAPGQRGGIVGSVGVRF